MGRYKELLDKRSKGAITADEEKELKSLEADFAETKADTGTSDDEAKAIEELSSKLAEATTKKIQESLKDSKDVASTPSVVSDTKMVFDGREGKAVPVDSLADEKLVIQERKRAGKQHFEVSRKTLLMVQALFQGDRQKLQLLTEGNADSGGYLVADEFVNLIIEDRLDATVMRNLATVLPVGSDSIHIPNIATRPQAFWRSEGAIKNTTTVTFGETVLTPYSLAAIAGLSNELVADQNLGPAIVNYVAQKIGEAIARVEDKAFWVGGGSGQPTGVDNYSFVTVAAGSTDASRADSLIQALWKLDQGYRRNAVYVMNKNTLAKVATLKDNNNNYLLQRLGDNPFPTIQGRPVYEQNDLADGKAFLGDFSYYYIADRQGITVDVSNEATVAGSSAFEKNLTFVRVEERVDGELTITDPVVELSGLGGA